MEIGRRGEKTSIPRYQVCYVCVCHTIITKPVRFMTSSENEEAISTIADCFEACKLGNVEVVVETLSSHPELLTINYNGLFLIHLAIIQESMAMFEALINVAESIGVAVLSLETSENKSVLELSIMSNNIDLFKLLHQKLEDFELKIKVNDDVTETYDITDPDYCSIPALHFAAYTGKLKVCQYYLSNFPSAETVHLVSLVNRQPLYYAAVGGHLAICEMLLKHGADINNSDEFGLTAKLKVCMSYDDNNRAIVALFLKHGCDINADSTCLRLAAMNNNHDMVTYLLSIGARYEDGDHLVGCSSCFIEGGYALQDARPTHMRDFLALQEHDYDTSQMMINDNSRDEGAYRHMFLATTSMMHSDARGKASTWSCESSRIHFLISAGYKRIMSRNDTMLNLGYSQNRNKVEEEDVILALLDGSLLVNLNPFTLALETAFSTARQTNSLTLFKSILVYIPDKNSVFNEIEPSRWTLLHTICAAEAKEWTASFVQLLVQEGADVNVLSNAGDSALLLACAGCLTDLKNVRVDVIKELLLAGAEVNHVNQQGSTALLYAERIVIDESKDEMCVSLKATLFQLLEEAGGR